MKSTFKVLGIIALAAIIGFAPAGCGDPEGGLTGTPPDPLAMAKAELQTAISAATAAKAAVGTPTVIAGWTEGTLTSAGACVVGAAAADIPVGLKAVAADPASAIEAYGTAITAAQAALDSAATVAEASQAKDDLDAATITFNAALGTAGTKSLKARIAAATGTITIYLYGDENFAGVTSANIANKTITLEGVGAERTITLSSAGRMFYLGVNGKLTLNANVTLKGFAANNTVVVNVNASTAVLTMNDGSKITGNMRLTTDDSGSGVAIHNGTFNMTGGEISDNHAPLEGGSGVRIYSYNGTSTFNMSGGIITGNTGTHGGGVFMNSENNGASIFTMSGGTISGNIADVGGGVMVNNRSLRESSGGGINTFTMTGGTISGNTAAVIGGGVFVQTQQNLNSGSTTFTMSGDSTISGNTAAYGGGLAILKASLVKTGGAITGNTATVSTPVSTAAVLVLAEENEEGAVAYRDTGAGAGDNITVTWNSSSSQYTTLSGVTAIP
ncbi:MAG: hypothetical protein LBQ35_09235 [Spirochaetaceae bacterium]|jgi:hypothetical protein|nr:hypothetical protein [Spirochaetaceae bacterium]